MKQTQPITIEEAAKLEMAYGQVLAHLKLAKAEIEAMKKADILGVTAYIQFIESRVEKEIIYYAWREIVLRHPLMERLNKTTPMKVDAIMWSIGLSDSPPITQRSILRVMEQIEDRRTEIEAHIQGEAGMVTFETVGTVGGAA